MIRFVGFKNIGTSFKDFSDFLSILSCQNIILFCILKFNFFVSNLTTSLNFEQLLPNQKLFKLA